MKIQSVDLRVGWLLESISVELSSILRSNLAKVAKPKIFEQNLKHTLSVWGNSRAAIFFAKLSPKPNSRFRGCGGFIFRLSNHPDWQPPAGLPLTIQNSTFHQLSASRVKSKVILLMSRAQKHIQGISPSTMSQRNNQ